MRSTHKLGAAAAVVTLLTGGMAALSAPGAAAADWSRCLDGTTDRQAVFARAATVSGVPESVLLGVSFMQSRWDDHGTSPSTSGGYGPMHLTQVDASAVADPHLQGKGESAHAHEGDAGTSDSPGVDPAVDGLFTLDEAAGLVGATPARLRADDVANICGGAALLASYQRDLGPDGADGSGAHRCRGLERRGGEVQRRRRRGLGAPLRRAGLHRDPRGPQPGHQRRPAGHAGGHPRPGGPGGRGVDGARGRVDRGRGLPGGAGLRVDPGAVREVRRLAGAYGNHDLADRQADMDIDYIVIHDTEASWNTTLQLVQRPNYLAWNYSLRSRDGHIAQHLDSSDVGWHAGNWYVNMHSIGLEHEGFAAQGASWYTESMYQTSSALVRHLAAKYDVPLDRAHIIGHDQIPGHVPSRVPAMHWDPGPYWDWEHYFDLLGAPIAADRTSRSDVVTVAPGYDGNSQPVTSCGTTPCQTDATNFVYLHQAPDASAPLVNDPGMKPNGAPATTSVSDIGARAAAGSKFLVAQRPGTGSASGGWARSPGSTAPRTTRAWCPPTVRSWCRPGRRRCRSTAAPTRSPPPTRRRSRTRASRRCSTP